MAVFIKYLVGAFLLQGATVLLVMTTQDAGLQKSGWQLVSIGVLIGLGYFLASEMTANSGVVFGFDPAIVTWMPSIALLLVTSFALSRVR